MSHTNHEWVLPRSYKVIGALPLLITVRSNRHSTGWRLGSQLAMQRRWDAGDRETSGHPGELKLSAAAFADADTGQFSRTVTRLAIDDIESLDCARVVELFPAVRSLNLDGRLGRLDNAHLLNRLADLRHLAMSNLFGMTASDALQPASVPALEWVAIHSVPREYGAAMRIAWAAEVPKGCFLAISALRGPEWLVENLENPLRDWDGRDHISATKFRRAVAQYKATRRAVLDLLDRDPEPGDQRARLVELGQEFGEAFNKLAARDDFIETEEREELFAALMEIPTKSAHLDDAGAKKAGEWLAEGLDAARDW